MLRLNIAFNPKDHVRNVVPQKTARVRRLTRGRPRWHCFDGFDDTDEPDCVPVDGMPQGERARLVRSADHWEIHRLINGSWMLCPGLYPTSLSALNALEELVFAREGHDPDE